MVWMNKTPFKLSLNSKGNDRIAHRKAMTEPLATIFEGDNDKVYPFTRAFAARIESIGIETTFGVKTTPEHQAQTKVMPPRKLWTTQTTEQTGTMTNTCEMKAWTIL
jgi:hypothetical protein